MSYCPICVDNNDVDHKDKIFTSVMDLANHAYEIHDDTTLKHWLARWAALVFQIHDARELLR